MLWLYFASDFDITATRSYDQSLWLHFYFYKSYDKQTWNDDKPVYIALTLQVMMTSPQLDHVMHVYGFISLSIILITT